MVRNRVPKQVPNSTSRRLRPGRSPRPAKRLGAALGIALGVTCGALARLAYSQDEAQVLRLANRGRHSGPPPQVQSVPTPAASLTHQTFAVDGATGTGQATQLAEMALLENLLTKQGAQADQMGDLASRSAAFAKDLEAQRQQGLQLLAGQNWLTAKVTEALASPNRNRFLVEVALNRDPDQVAEAYRAVACGNLSVVTLLPEYVDGTPHTPSVVDAALEGALTDKEFKVYDWHFVVSDAPVRTLVENTVNNIPPSLLRLGQHFLANTIIVGRVEVTSDAQPDRGGTHWCRAKTILRVLKNGQTLTAMTFPDVEKEDEEFKGYGRDKEEAAEMALRRLAKAVKTRLSAKMLQDFPRYPTTVQYLLSGSATEREQQINALTAQLQAVVGKGNVSVLPSGADTLQLGVLTPLNRAELGARIEARGVYTVEQLTRR